MVLEIVTSYYVYVVDKTMEKSKLKNSYPKYSCSVCNLKNDSFTFVTVRHACFNYYYIVISHIFELKAIEIKYDYFCFNC